MAIYIFFMLVSACMVTEIGGGFIIQFWTKKAGTPLTHSTYFLVIKRCQISITKLSTGAHRALVQVARRAPPDVVAQHDPPEPAAVAPVPLVPARRLADHRPREPRRIVARGGRADQACSTWRPQPRSKVSVQFSRAHRGAGCQNPHQ
mgnify:CR=1 FL=1